MKYFTLVTALFCYLKTFVFICPLLTKTCIFVKCKYNTQNPTVAQHSYFSSCAHFSPFKKYCFRLSNHLRTNKQLTGIQKKGDKPLKKTFIKVQIFKITYKFVSLYFYDFV